MHKNIFSFYLLIFTILIGYSSVNAQKTTIHKSVDYIFNDGLDLFNKQKYGAAQDKFRSVINYFDTETSDIKTDAEFYTAICAIELFNKDAEYLIQNFINNHPESSKVKDAYFEMGVFQYRKKKYPQAIKWLKKVNTYDLDNKQLAEYYFKFGYSNFSQEKYKEASDAFYEIKDTENKYIIPALYYYSHIEHNNKNYETALTGFVKLTDNELFAPIVPYYITQIYYLQNKYDKVIEYAPSLLDSATTKRQPEIARVIGESYYKTAKYKEAIPYLEMYKEKAAELSRTDVYELGYAYYRNGDYDKAIKSLVDVTFDDDSISQNAYYHIGYCYTKLNDFNNAMLAFESSSKFDFNKKMQEDALWNYSKLAYQLTFSPFNNVINAFTDFVEKFPNSEHIDEANVFLGEIYLSTKNYKEAIESLENIRKVTDKVEMIYQRVSFYRGVELYNEHNYKGAIILFNKSINNSKYDKRIYALSTYWRADSYYRLKRYYDAIKGYKKFLLTPGAIIQDEYDIAHYNLGYSYFKLDKHKESIKWFRKYTDRNKESESKLMCDAYNRIGDCYYVDRNFDYAIDYYNKSLDINKANVDYALFQRSFSYGLTKDYNQEIIGLSQIVNDYPNSPFIDDAYFELGNAYTNIGANDMALNNYQNIIDEYPNSSYVKKAYLKLGLIFYNSDDTDEALNVYKNTVRSFPGTEEAKNALSSIKNIYVETNAVEQYFTFVESVDGLTKLSLNEKDSLTYLSAEKLYMSGNCSESRPLFATYINKYKHGAYILNAHFYKAECEVKAGNDAEALTSYDYVIGKPKSDFTEFALLKSAELNYKLEKYNEALVAYTGLEKYAEYDKNVQTAKIGKMKSAYKIKSYDNALKYSKVVLSIDKLSNETFREAHFIIAESYYGKNNFDYAFDEYQILAQNVKNRNGAISKYRIIEILKSQKDFDESETQILDFVKQGTPYQYWLAKSFIIWADIYVEKENYFQAKSTLKSVIDGYENQTDGIVEEAKLKLTEIYEQEAEEKQIDEALEDEINFFNEMDEDLFNDDESEVIIEETVEEEIIKEEVEIE